MMVATGDVAQLDLEVTPAVFHYQFGSNSSVDVRISNVTTRSVDIPPRSLLCEIQKITLEEMLSDTTTDNDWLLQKIAFPTPIKQRHHHIPPLLYEEVKQHIKQLLMSGIIQKSERQILACVCSLLKAEHPHGKRFVCTTQNRLSCWIEILLSGQHEEWVQSN